MMTSILVGRGVCLSPLTLEEADYDHLPNLGISWVPKTGSDEVKPSIGEPM